MLHAQTRPSPKRSRCCKFHGMDREAWKRFAQGGRRATTSCIPGFKYNMMDIQAALGIHQLPKLDGFIDCANELAELYHDAFEGLDGSSFPARCRTPHATPGTSTRRWWTWSAHDRPRPFMQELKERNIGSGLHYTAVHQFAYYREHYGWKPADFPEADSSRDRIVSLPLFPMYRRRPGRRDRGGARDRRAVRQVSAAKGMVSVVIPVFNEEATLPTLIPRLTAALGALGRPTRSSSWTTAAATGRSICCARIGEAARARGGRGAEPQFRPAPRDPRRLRSGARRHRSSRSTPTCRTRPRRSGSVAKMDEGFDVVGGVRQQRQDTVLPARRLVDGEPRHGRASPASR